MGSCSTTEAAHTDKMGKGQNEGDGGFSAEQIQMYKDCFKLTSTRMAPWTRMTSVELLITLVSSCPSLNLMTSWERLEVHAMSWASSTCSRRRWLEVTMTLMISSSRLSWPTIREARSMSRCSSTPSWPGETR